MVGNQLLIFPLPRRARVVREQMAVNGYPSPDLLRLSTAL